MILRLPDWVEDAVWQAVTARLPAPARARPALVRAVVERSRRYTSERELLAAPLPRAEAAADLAARAVFFSIADAGKVMVPLGELAGRGLLPSGEPLRVLDLGAGAGAMTLGLLAFLAAREHAGRVEVWAVDHDAAALAVLDAAVGALPAELGRRLAVTSRAGDLAAPLPAGPFDLILAGSVLNELPAPAHAPLVARALGALGPGGAMVIVEPALRESARALHRARDHVLAAGAAHVFAPCTRRGAPCPMLADERDWCHEHRAGALPPRANALAVATGLRDDGVRFSYLVLRHGAEPLVEPSAGRRALRVVSHPHAQKGKIEALGCGDDGMARLRLLRRHRSEANRGFERAERGDVLVIGDGVGTDVGPGDQVTRLRPAE